MDCDELQRRKQRHQSLARMRSARKGSVSKASVFGRMAAEAQAKASVFGRTTAEAQGKASVFGRMAAEAQGKAVSHQTLTSPALVESSSLASTSRYWARCSTGPQGTAVFQRHRFREDSLPAFPLRSGLDLPFDRYGGLGGWTQSVEYSLNVALSVHSVI